MGGGRRGSLASCGADSGPAPCAGWEQGQGLVSLEQALANVAIKDKRCARARVRARMYICWCGVSMGVGWGGGVRVGMSVCECAWQGDREKAGGEVQLRGAGDWGGRSRGC